MTKTRRATLKSFFSPTLVRRLGADIARVHQSFPERAFVRDACAGLQRLELLDRGKHIAAALAKHLPPAPNAHVRRLVSEGTRLRLPWASRVAWLDANQRSWGF